MLKLQFKNVSKPSIWLVDPVLLIGSDQHCDIQLEGEQIAPLHAELRVNEDRVTLVPGGHNHPTLVNQQSVRKDQLLQPWDLVTVGSVELQIIDPLDRGKPTSLSFAAGTVNDISASDWQLVGETHPFSGQLFPIRTTLTVGRGQDCDVVLPDQFVSRHHAQLLLSDSRLLLKDMGSKNGTFVNNKAVNECFLQVGDEIRLEQFVFRVIHTVDDTKHGSDNKESDVQNNQEKRRRSMSAVLEKLTSSQTGTEQAMGSSYKAPPAFLHGKSRDIRGKVYQVDPEGTQLGRMLGHHLSREESSVSARHIEMFKRDQFWCIKNNGAANGLLVNGRMATESTLLDGDEVTVGGMSLVFQCKGYEPIKPHFDDEPVRWDLGRTAIALAAVAIAAIVMVWLLA